MFKTINIKTKSKVELIEITDRINKIIKQSNVKEGFCFIFVPHSTASITLNENYVVEVLEDIKNKMSNLVPVEKYFIHFEPDIMHGNSKKQYCNSDSHIKTSLFGSSVNLIIEKAKAAIGQYQGIFFCEFDGPRDRKLYIKISNVPNL